MIQSLPCDCGECSNCRLERKRRYGRQYGRLRELRFREGILAAAREPGGEAAGRPRDLAAATKVLATKHPRSVLAEIERVGHDLDFRPTSASAPTASMPGSREKVEVLSARMLAGEELWHPGDCRPTEEPD